MAYIGGMIATNCSGTNAMRYGARKDHVVNLTVVLADGTVIKTRQRLRKISARYNLNSLLTGSEGTLGVVTEATLKLAILPTNFSLAVVAFKSNPCHCSRSIFTGSCWPSYGRFGTDG